MAGMEVLAPSRTIPRPCTPVKRLAGVTRYRPLFLWQRGRALSGSWPVTFARLGNARVGGT